MKKRVKSKNKNDYRVCPECGGTLKCRVDFDAKESDYLYYGFLCDKCKIVGQTFRYDSDWSRAKRG